MSSPDLELTYRDGGTGDAGDPYTGLDRFGRLVETLWKQGTSDRVRSKYGRNSVGGIVWRRDEQAHAQDVDTEDNLYGYDGLQQVKARQRGDLTGTAPDYTGITSLQQQEGWTYDSTGNWAAYSDTSPTNAQTRTHNRANEITQIASAPDNVEPGYDPVGNMLTLPKEPGLSAEQYDLVWDAWNRLVAVKDGITSVASYTYDGLTRRLTKANAAETRHYYYNAAWRALEERVEGAAYLVDRQYSWGLRDRWDLLRRKRSVSASLDETLYVLRDYLDPVAIVDGSGAVVERYAYDTFGAVRFLAPDYSSRSASDFAWDFLFHSEFRDTDTNLYNYGYRYYDAGLGRWLNRDPIGETAGFNLYIFVGNNPCNTFDIFGAQPRNWVPPQQRATRGGPPPRELEIVRPPRIQGTKPGQHAEDLSSATEDFLKRRAMQAEGGIDKNTYNAGMKECLDTAKQIKKGTPGICCCRIHFFFVNVVEGGGQQPYQMFQSAYFYPMSCSEVLDEDAKRAKRKEEGQQFFDKDPYPGLKNADLTGIGYKLKKGPWIELGRESIDFECCLPQGKPKFRATQPVKLRD